MVGIEETSLNIDNSLYYFDTEKYCKEFYTAKKAFFSENLNPDLTPDKRVTAFLQKLETIKFDPWHIELEKEKELMQKILNKHENILNELREEQQIYANYLKNLDERTDSYKNIKDEYTKIQSDIFAMNFAKGEACLNTERFAMKFPNVAINPNAYIEFSQLNK